MSATISPGTAQPYGVKRVCEVWRQARSTVYAQRARLRSPVMQLARRGPKPVVSNAELLAHIRLDLETTPFIGEGHRKVWARLRVGPGVRVSRTRVLRVMRENKLLSPHRGRQGTVDPHDREIITHEPNVMWGSDGARVLAVVRQAIHFNREA